MNYLTPDSGYQQSDLVDAVAQLHIDADMIAAIAEDLPDGALTRACAQHCGNDNAPYFESVIVDIVDTEVVDSEPYDRIVEQLFSD
jgi:hypothetical protein